MLTYPKTISPEIEMEIAMFVDNLAACDGNEAASMGPGIVAVTVGNPAATNSERRRFSKGV